MLDIYFIAPNIGAVFFVLLGVFGFTFPHIAAAFVGLEPVSTEGISEMRATLGSFFFGLGIACLWLHLTSCFYYSRYRLSYCSSSPFMLNFYRSQFFH